MQLNHHLPQFQLTKVSLEHNAVMKRFAQIQPMQSMGKHAGQVQGRNSSQEET